MENEIVLADVPSDLPAIQGEIGEIETLMRTNRPAYNRDVAKQTRLRDLYTARERSQTIVTADSPASMSRMEIMSKSEFMKDNPQGDYGYYVRAMREVADVTLAVPAGERDRLIDGFEALPGTVTAYMVHELLNKQAIAPEWVTDEGLRAAAKVPGGSIVQEWGHIAKQKVGLVRARLFRLLASFPTDRDADRFMDWLEGLSDAQAKAVYRKLAA